MSVILSDEQMERLQPFLYRKEPRQRVILYLLGAGYTVPELTQLTVDQLAAMKVSVGIASYRDEVVETATTSMAFCGPTGRRMIHNDYYTLLRRATQRALGAPLGQRAFSEYIQDGSI